MMKTRLALLTSMACAFGLIALSANANSIPTRSKSDYGANPATDIPGATANFSNSGVTIQANAFCPDNSLGDTGPTGTPPNGNTNCGLGFGYQITAIPTNASSLTLTFTGAGANFTPDVIVNDGCSGVTPLTLCGGVFFTTFASSTTTLPATWAYQVVSGNLILTFDSLQSLPGEGQGLAFTLNFGPFGTNCAYNSADTTDTPCSSFDSSGNVQIFSPQIALTTTPVNTTPEPGTLLLIGPALGMLGLARKRLAP